MPDNAAAALYIIHTDLDYSIISPLGYWVATQQRPSPHLTADGSQNTVMCSMESGPARMHVMPAGIMYANWAHHCVCRKWSCILRMLHCHWGAVSAEARKQLFASYCKIVDIAV